MSNISEIDKNFKIEVPQNKENIKFYDIDQKPFKVYGLIREGETYCRMPENIAKNVNDGVLHLCCNTAGGRVRFVTDSKVIHINASMCGIDKMPHCPLTGTAGFDMYISDGEKEIYSNTFVPPFNIKDGYESCVDLGSSEKRTITINFPLYSNVKQLFIGLEEGSSLHEAADYKTEKPAVYYGSSITQGGCASRPGTCYQAIISRKLDLNYINLGFSGSARGEDEMAEYIKNLDMSVFIYDYDHNAPSPEHLRNTHKRMFDIIRKENPRLPIVLLSRPVPRFKGDEEERFNIIKETYQSAKDSGDNNVYFIDGRDLISEEIREVATVDGCHPNDNGFLSMAQKLSEVLTEIL